MSTTVRNEKAARKLVLFLLSGRPWAENRCTALTLSNAVALGWVNDKLPGAYSAAHVTDAGRKAVGA